MQLGAQGRVINRKGRGGAHALVGDVADLTLHAGEVLLECSYRFLWPLNKCAKVGGGHLLGLIPLEGDMKLLAESFPQVHRAQSKRQIPRSRHPRELEAEALGHGGFDAPCSGHGSPMHMSELAGISVAVA